MKIAIHGLGKMGFQIARKLSESGFEVIAHNRSRQPIDDVGNYGARSAYEKRDVQRAFNNQQLVLWLMLPVDIVNEQLDEWLSIVPSGSVIVDGGNSDYRLTKKRAQRASKAGSALIDVGTSGGIWGYDNGFSMMAGGDRTAFKIIEPALKALSKPNGGYQHFGDSGSGHFVKMVHNAIEYGMMESLAEGYRLLKEGPYEGLNLAAAGDVWQKSSVVTSWLNELSKQALDENPELIDINGVVAESGEARWALQTAKDLNIPMPSIQASFDVRLASQRGEVNFATKLLAAMRNRFGGHKINPNELF
jgi:6-phosphogluconate dehydrogenase